MSTNTLFNPLSFFAYIADIPVPASSSNDDPEIQILQKQRKRKRQEEKWQTNVKKASRQKGLEYVGRKYKEDGTYEKVLKPARKIGTRFCCKRATKWPSRIERGISHRPGGWGRTGYSAACNLGS